MAGDGVAGRRGHRRERRRRNRLSGWAARHRGRFDFAYVGFAALWGILFFDEVPDAVTLGGMALIVVAGLLAVRR
jgi:hypothetical protein